jgi:hypothetical protein
VVRRTIVVVGIAALLGGGGVAPVAVQGASATAIQHVCVITGTAHRSSYGTSLQTLSGFGSGACADANVIPAARVFWGMRDACNGGFPTCASQPLLRRIDVSGESDTPVSGASRKIAQVWQQLGDHLYSVHDAVRCNGEPPYFNCKPGARRGTAVMYPSPAGPTAPITGCGSDPCTRGYSVQIVLTASW